MAKSTGNIARVGELLEAGVSPRALRYALIAVHYRARAQLQRRVAGGGGRRGRPARCARRRARRLPRGRPGRCRACRPCWTARDAGVRRGARRRPEHLGRARGGLRSRPRAQSPDRRALALDGRRASGRSRCSATFDDVLGVLPDRPTSSTSARAGSCSSARRRAREPRLGGVGSAPRRAGGARHRRRGHPRRPALAPAAGGGPWLTGRRARVRRFEWTGRPSAIRPAAAAGGRAARAAGGRAAAGRRRRGSIRAARPAGGHRSGPPHGPAGGAGSRAAAVGVGDRRGVDGDGGGDRPDDRPRQTGQRRAEAGLRLRGGPGASSRPPGGPVGARRPRPGTDGGVGVGRAPTAGSHRRPFRGGAGGRSARATSVRGPTRTAGAAGDRGGRIAGPIAGRSPDPSPALGRRVRRASRGGPTATAARTRPRRVTGPPGPDPVAYTDRPVGAAGRPTAGSTPWTGARPPLDRRRRPPPRRGGPRPRRRGAGRGPAPGRGGVRRRPSGRSAARRPQRRQALERLVLHATSLRIPVVEVEGGTLTVDRRVRRPPGDRPRRRSRGSTRARRCARAGRRAGRAALHPRARFARGSPERRHAAAERRGRRRPRRRLPDPSPGAAHAGRHEGVGRRRRASAALPGGRSARRARRISASAACGSPPPRPTRR